MTDGQVESLSKAELLEAIRIERKRLEETLAELSQEQIIQSGVEGEWSVKDILMHIATWERRMVRWIGMVLNGEKPDFPPWEELDEWNALSFLENRNRPLAEVLLEFQDCHRQALETTRELTDQELHKTYADRWPEGSLWWGVAANTCWHYKTHHAAILAWLKKGK